MQGIPDASAISGAEDSFRGAFRVRHEPKHVAPFVDDPRDVPHGPIGIVSVLRFAFGAAIPENDSVLPFKTLHLRFWKEIQSLVMGNRHLQNLIQRANCSKGRIISLYPDRAVLAKKGKTLVSEYCSGKEMRFSENLKTVAYAENQSALFCKSPDGVHDGGSCCHGTATKIIAVGEPSWEDHKVNSSREIVRFVPHSFGFSSDCGLQ
jgi:hypothetical protein